jgi:hypothetical protein
MASGAVSDGRCAPIWIGVPGAARRAALARSAAHSHAASRDGGRCASSISLARSSARTFAPPAKARAHASTSRACARSTVGPA